VSVPFDVPNFFRSQRRIKAPHVDLAPGEATSSGRRWSAHSCPNILVWWVSPDAWGVLLADEHRWRKFRFQGGRQSSELVAGERLLPVSGSVSWSRTARAGASRGTAVLLKVVRPRGPSCWWSTRPFLDGCRPNGIWGSVWIRGICPHTLGCPLVATVLLAVVAGCQTTGRRPAARLETVGRPRIVVLLVSCGSKRALASGLPDGRGFFFPAEHVSG